VEVAAGGLKAQGFLGALTENRQLHLAECSLHAEQQAIVYLFGIVDAVFVYDQAVEQGAELQERMPITTIASKSGGFYREHGAGGASADRGQQSLEPRPCRPAARTPEIIVYDDHLRPPKRPRSRRKGILAATALRIIDELVRCGLPHINIGGAR
jgi:hypothetical protein